MCRCTGEHWQRHLGVIAASSLHRPSSSPSRTFCCIGSYVRGICRAGAKNPKERVPFNAIQSLNDQIQIEIDSNEESESKRLPKLDPVRRTALASGPLAPSSCRQRLGWPRRVVANVHRQAKPLCWAENKNLGLPRAKVALRGL